MKNYFCVLTLDSMGLTQVQNEVFHYLLEFGYGFLKILYNDSLQQFLASSTDEIHQTNGAQIWVKWVKLGPKIWFLAIFSSLVH